MIVLLRSATGRRRLRERGQALLLMILVMTVIFAIMAVAIDVGFWLSERRGAQSDGDFSVLAGAQRYLADPTDTNGAFNDAVTWAVKNGIDPATIDGAPGSACVVPNSCINVGIGNCREDGTDQAMPWVEARIRHDSPALFFTLFGLGDPDVGAIARACVGSPRQQYNLSPFGIQTNFVPTLGDPETGDQCLEEPPADSDGDGEVDDGCPLSDCVEPDPANPGQTRPVYGAVCILKLGAQNSISGQRGQLTLDSDCYNTSTSDLEHDFHYGSLSLCTLGQDVTTGTGNILGLTDGLADRLAEEGKCDQLFGTGHPGYDDFNEVFGLPAAEPGTPIIPSADLTFSENPCFVITGVDVPPDSYDPSHTHAYIPRALDLVLIDQLDGGDQVATITGFAGFYAVGCFDRDIIISVKLAIEQDLNNIDQYMNRCFRAGAQDDILGIFVRKLAPPTIVADPDPNLPLSIVLVK